MNILGIEELALAENFQGGDPHERFRDVHRSGPSGSPIIDGMLAYFDCKVDDEPHSCTHTIIIGSVLEAGERVGAPLGFFDRAYRDLKIEL